MSISRNQNHQPSNNISKKSFENISEFKYFEMLITKRNRFIMKLGEYILSVPIIIQFKTVMILRKIDFVHRLNYKITMFWKLDSAFVIGQTLRGTLTRPNRKVQDTRQCIYSIPCDCGRCHIRETSRSLSIWIGEHMNNSKQGLVEKSRLEKHACGGH
jgi:hypothetical protein